MSALNDLRYATRTLSHAKGFTVAATATLAIGIVLGLAGAFATGRFLRGMLFGIEPMDPFTLTAAVAVLIVTAVATCYFPIRRATRVDATALLRDV